MQILVFEFLQYYERQPEHRADSEYQLCIDTAYMLKGEIRHDDYNKAEHEAVAVIQPIRTLESVPNEVDCT